MTNLLWLLIFVVIGLVVLGFPVRLIACVFSAKTRQQVRRRWFLHTVWGLFTLFIVVAVSVPDYSDYTVRARVSEGFAIGARTKTAVSEFWLQNGRFPSNNTEVGIEQSPNSRYVQNLTVDEGGKVTVTFTNDDVLSSDARGRTIVFTPESVENEVKWYCTGGTMPYRYRPANCRPDKR